MIKHRLKMGLRRTVSLAGRATGLWRAANACARRGRVTLLTLHCVGTPPGTDHLPSYMKIAEADFDGLLGLLSRSFEMIDLEEALRRLKAGEKGRNAVVITLDDGYLDNRTCALPILEKHGVPATIFLEVGAVDRRSLAWIHKYFFVDRHKGSDFFARQYLRRTGEAGVAEKLGRGPGTEYAVKKVLKYEANPRERDRITDEIFKELGGDERKILDEAYLDWDDVRAMKGREITFGCHTITHPILSALDREEARQEIVESRAVLREKGGIDTAFFAYPWGRSWDFNDETKQVLREEGFACGLAMDASAALPEQSDPFNLSRYPLAQGFRTADILAVASGLYDWFGGRL